MGVATGQQMRPPVCTTCRTATYVRSEANVRRHAVHYRCEKLDCAACRSAGVQISDYGGWYYDNGRRKGSAAKPVTEWHN